MNDANFPLPDTLDLDFDYDFEGQDLPVDSRGLMPPAGSDYMFDQQYGAVAALATQGAVVRPVLVNPNPSAQQHFQQDWQMLQQTWDPQDQLPDFGQMPHSSSSGQGTDSFQPQPLWDSSFPGLPQPSAGQQDFFGSMAGFAPALYQEPSQPLFQQPCGLAASGSMHDSVSSGDHRSGELKEGEPMDAESKAERTKAKNKKAQKKFRQKQKERHAELERSAAELSERLKRTLSEVDGLQNQKKVLEIALSRNTEAASTAPPTQESEEPLFIPAQGFERFSSKAGILMEVLFVPPKRFSHEQAIRLSLKDHSRIWKLQCQQANELLKSGASDPDSAAGKKLRALLNERHGLLALTSVNNPVIMHKLMTSKLVDPPVPDHQPPPPEFWQRILEAMMLTPEQQDCLLKARNTYLAEVGRLLEERRKLQTTLRGLDTGFKSALGDKARTHVLWAEAVRALQDNVDEFHICHCLFMVTVYSHGQGFTVAQEASLLVESFPHAPDVFALLKELAVMRGEPAAPPPSTSVKPESTSAPARQTDYQAPCISLADKMESAITAVSGKFVQKLQL